MAACYAAADLVICRGGGTTVAELAVAGRPAVIVPYPHHKDRQQLRNAEVLARAGAALIVEEATLTVDALAQLLGELLGDPERLGAMGRAAAGTARPDAAAAIVDDIELQVARARPEGRR
jgi:UDP-N-acetylglucosamine--N-acetylmuramyl-(pentapeptide) pyrophosphoryl-undecaprenol N-acetylglucosamine transferase